MGDELWATGKMLNTEQEQASRLVQNFSTVLSFILLTSSYTAHEQNASKRLFAF